MFKEYDFKKMLPRIIFAFIALNVSWSLMKIFFVFVNTLGDSIYGILVSPFSSLQAISSSAPDWAGKSSSTASSLGFLALGAVGIGVAVGSIAILPFVIGAIFSMLFGGVLLVLRKVILIFLIIVSPLPIALSVFPKTEKIYKQWWSLFAKLLMMYPIFAAMAALMKVASGLMLQSTFTNLSGGTPITNFLIYLIALILPFVPLFMVVNIFKWATSSVKGASKGIAMLGGVIGGGVMDGGKPGKLAQPLQSKMPDKKRADTLKATRNIMNEERNKLKYSGLLGDADGSTPLKRLQRGIRGGDMLSAVGIRGVLPGRKNESQQGAFDASIQEKAAEIEKIRLDNIINNRENSGEFKADLNNPSGPITEDNKKKAFLDKEFREAKNDSTRKAAILGAMLAEDSGIVRSYYDRGLVDEDTSTKFASKYKDTIDKKAPGIFSLKDRNSPNSGESPKTLRQKALLGAKPEGMTDWDSSTWKEFDEAMANPQLKGYINKEQLKSLWDSQESMKKLKPDQVKKIQDHLGIQRVDVDKVDLRLASSGSSSDTNSRLIRSESQPRGFRSNATTTDSGLIVPSGYTDSTQPNASNSGPIRPQYNINQPQPSVDVSSNPSISSTLPPIQSSSSPRPPQFESSTGLRMPPSVTSSDGRATQGPPSPPDTRSRFDASTGLPNPDFNISRTTYDPRLGGFATPEEKSALDNGVSPRAVRQGKLS